MTTAAGTLPPKIARVPLSGTNSAQHRMQMATAINNLAGAVEPLLGDVNKNLTATGSSQSTALVLTRMQVQVFSTVGAGTGAIVANTLPAARDTKYVNYGSNALLIYPPVGGTIANGSINAPFSVPPGKTLTLTTIDNLTHAANLSS